MLKVSVAQRGLHSTQRLLDKASPALDSIIRVDHAGELGADRIYAGQFAVLGNTKSGPVIKEMWEQEKHHKAKFEQLIVKHRVRPTVLTPLWNVAGFALGAGTALLGEKAAMACTVAVETVIVEHYNDQLRTLMAEPGTDKELLETIKQFRDEEQEHHDCGIDHGAEQAPFYQVLSEVIKFGCRAAISASKGFLQPPKLCMLSTRNYCTGSKIRWDIATAVCVERKPTITRPLTPLEQQYKQALSELEVEQSRKSDHEIRLEDDKKRLAELKNREVTDDIMETALKQSGQDYEDAKIAERSRFTPASRIGPDDLHSLRRKPDLHLVLITKLKLGDQNVWGLPQCFWRENETLRETADRTIASSLGEKLRVSVLGNAPFGYFRYKYPKPVRQDVEGVKLFIFKGIYQSGAVEISDEFASDHQWVSRGELGRIIVNKKYLRSIQNFLIDEDELEGEEIEKKVVSSTN